MSNEAPMIRLVDLIPHLMDGVRLCVKCKFRGMNEYQDYYGLQIADLPSDILKTLYVQRITTELELLPDGLVPVLVITASDSMTMIAIDPNGLFQQFCQNSDDMDFDEPPEIIN